MDTFSSKKRKSKKVRGLRVQRNCAVVSVGGNDIKIKDFVKLRAKPPQGPQTQALTVSDSPVYHAFTRHRIYNSDPNTT